MTTHRVKIRRLDDKVFQVSADDSEQNVEVTITDWDFLNGKRGTEAICALSCAINREVALFPHPVHVVNTFKRTILIVDKLTKAGEPKHAVRYLHKFNTKRFDIVKRGDLRQQKVILYAPRRRDKLGFRPKSRPYVKKSGNPAVRRRPQVGRGLGARTSEQRAWINDFIEKYGPKLPALQ